MSDASPTVDLGIMPFTATLGITQISATRQEIKARLDWSESLCTTGGAMHGGALMALADSTGGLCAFLNLPNGATGTTTIESKTNFLRGVSTGWVEATSCPLHVGRTVVVVETNLTDSAGRLVARVTQTQLVMRQA